MGGVDLELVTLTGRQIASGLCECDLPDGTKCQQAAVRWFLAPEIVGWDHEQVNGYCCTHAPKGTGHIEISRAEAEAWWVHNT